MAAGLARAKSVVITLADTPASLRVLHQVEHLRPGMTVLVRTTDDADLRKLQALMDVRVLLIEGHASADTCFAAGEALGVLSKVPVHSAEPCESISLT